jgi:hypothetical protein
MTESQGRPSDKLEERMWAEFKRLLKSAGWREGRPADGERETYWLFFKAGWKIGRGKKS